MSRLDRQAQGAEDESLARNHFQRLRIVVPILGIPPSTHAHIRSYRDPRQQAKGRPHERRSKVAEMKLVWHKAVYVQDVDGSLGSVLCPKQRVRESNPKYLCIGEQANEARCRQLPVAGDLALVDIL